MNNYVMTAKRLTEIKDEEIFNKLASDFYI